MGKERLLTSAGEGGIKKMKQSQQNEDQYHYRQYSFHPSSISFIALLLFIILLLYITLLLFITLFRFNFIAL